jgi:hypothetical protein
MKKPIIAPAGSPARSRGNERTLMLERILHEVTHGRVFDVLPDPTQERVQALTPEELQEGVRHALTRPMPRADGARATEAGRVLMNACLAAQWLEIFEGLALPRALRVFEPCAGSSEPVVLATEIYSDGAGEYTTLNLNRPLARQLREKIGKVRIPVRNIEDDAGRAGDHLEHGTFDAACFHHAINDLLQTAVAEPRGMNTREIDWWANEREMIEWLAEEAAAGQLDARALPALMGAVRQAVNLVRPGGILLFDHWTWEGHRPLPWFPWDLFCDLISLTRRSILQAGLPLEEIALPGRDPRWWMAWRRV